LVGDIVDAIAVLVLVGLAVGVHHRGLVPLAGEAVLLAVALLLAVSAGRVGVPDGGVGAGLIVGDALLLEAQHSELAKLVIWQVFPDDFFSFFFAYLLFDGVDLVEPLLVVLDGLQVAGGLDALGEGGLLHLEHLVTKAISQSGEEKLMLDEHEGVSNSFSLNLGLGGSGGNGDTHGSQSSRFFVCQALVGHLDALRVVVNGLVGFLVQIRKVGAGSFCGVLRLVSLQKFGFGGERKHALVLTKTRSFYLL
jgi:hypothetical protein